MTEIVSNSHFTAASFIDPHKKTNSLKSDIIVRCIVQSIKNELPITLDVIINAYLEYKFEGKEKKGFNFEDDNLPGEQYNNRWIYKVVDREYFKRNYKKLMRHYTPLDYAAIQWFRSNLGGAIMKGKILALPIIEI